MLDDQTRELTAAEYKQIGGEGSDILPPAPVKVCRECSAQAQTDGAFCPHCGTSYARKRRFTRRIKVALVVVLLLLLGGGATAGVLIKQDHDQQVAAKRHAAELVAQQKRDAAKRRVDEKKAQDRLERASRKDLVTSLEHSVTKDAKKDSDLGLIDGTVSRTECNPAGGADPSDLTTNSGDFSCLAVTADNADGTSSGYRFSATVNYDDFTYTWHLGG
jgi:predicted nucleic acid-binding Zn ribbon protein